MLSLRTPLLPLVIAGAAALAAGACNGTIGDGPAVPTEQPPSTPTNFVCNDELVPDGLPLRRLSLAQYRNTVLDLVRSVLPDEVDSIAARLEIHFDRLPEDRRVGPDKHFAGFTHLDQTMQQDHVDAGYAAAIEIGAALTESSERLELVFGSCAVDSDGGNDDACLDDFIQSFGERALRRPIDDEDVAFYRVPAGTPPFEPADYADVIASLLAAPHMLYFVEHGQPSSAEPTAPLDAYEVASRLSYHFWQTLPDDELFAAAASGELLTDAGFATQVERMWSHERTRAALETFFAEWLENTTLQELDSRAGTPVFDAFAGDYTPGPELREHMIAEVVDAASYYAFDAGGSYADFFASDRSFATSDDLAAIYGVAPWSGTGEPPALGPERAGLLTRAAYLATGSADTRPIMKGVFIRKALLCDEIPPPPPNAAANPPMLSEVASTRQVIEDLTGEGVCAGCHATLINPLGFATENFDALGRLRAEQTLFDEESGEVVGSAPIDTATVPTVDAGDETASAGAANLTRLILESDKPTACFARHYFRFTFGRLEDLDKDGCALAALKQSLDDHRPLGEVLKSVALTPAFRQRSFQGGEP